MPLLIQTSGGSLSLNEDVEHRCILNWRDCHEARGETLPTGEVQYSEEIVLSMVLAFLAPINVQSMSETRTVMVTGARETEKTRARYNQEILAIALSSLMTLAKPPTEQNVPAFSKWKAALVSQNLTDLIPASSWTSLHQLASVFQTIVAGKEGLRRELVDWVLTVNKTGAEGAIISQIRLVWEYSSLKAVQCNMILFTSSHCRALEIQAVLDQALLLKERWDTARIADPNLAFSRVRDPNSHPDLNQANYPHLYYAAISYAKLNKLVGENFLISTSHEASNALLIDRYVKSMASAELGDPSKDTRSKLIKLGYPVANPSRRRTRPRDSENEDDEEHEARRPRYR